MESHTSHLAIISYPIPPTIFLFLSPCPRSLQLSLLSRAFCERTQSARRAQKKQSRTLTSLSRMCQEVDGNGSAPNEPAAAPPQPGGSSTKDPAGRPAPWPRPSRSRPSPSPPRRMTSRCRITRRRSTIPITRANQPRGPRAETCGRFFT
jgi:hypothetical protein